MTPTPLPCYGLKAPSDECVIAAIARIKDEAFARKFFAQARQACGLEHVPALNLEQMEMVAVWITQQKGLISIPGHSLLVRIRTYKSLSR